MTSHEALIAEEKRRTSEEATGPGALADTGSVHSDDDHRENQSRSESQEVSSKVGPRGSSVTDLGLNLEEDEAGASLKTFAESGLDQEILKSLQNIGWSAPTPIQSLCLPFSLKGMDVAGFAQTGTGKTGVFLLTLGHLLIKAKKNKKTENGRPRAVILAPTRELAIQIEEECEKLLGDLGIRSLAVYGGASWEAQAKKLSQGVDVIAATPGRLRDYLEKEQVSLEDVSLFICDEADRMFDMGFIEDVELFLGKISKESQKMVFSATTNQRVDELVHKYLNDPEYISINPESITPDRISQHALICETPHKFKLLLWLLRKHSPERALIFVNTKLTALWLHHKLKANQINVDFITGDLAQSKRLKLISNIKEDKTNILIATDVASRGIHITGVTHVYNFDIPDEAANYIHRIGRTARAGAEGASYSILCEEYSGNYLAVQELLGENCPESTWPDPEFLDVEDKSGNPFEEGLNFFAGDSGRKAEQGRDRDNRGSRFDKSGRPDRQDKGDRERNRRPGQKYGAERGRYDEGSKAGGRSTYQKGRKQGQRRNRKESELRRGHQVTHRAPAKKQSRSVFAIIRRFFSLLFRRRK